MTDLNNNLTFPVILEEDETGGYVVTNPALEGCYSQGETVEEALGNIKEATALCLEEINEQTATAKIKNISLHMINLGSANITFYAQTAKSVR